MTVSSRRDATSELVGRNDEVAQVDADKNLLLIKGSVPGSRNAMVEVRTDG